MSKRRGRRVSLQPVLPVSLVVHRWTLSTLALGSLSRRNVFGDVNWCNEELPDGSFATVPPLPRVASSLEAGDWLGVGNGPRDGERWQLYQLPQWLNPVVERRITYAALGGTQEFDVASASLVCQSFASSPHLELRFRLRRNQRPDFTPIIVKVPWPALSTLLL